MAKILGMLIVLGIVAVPLLYRVSRDRDFRNFREVQPGVLYRSGQLTPEGFVRIVHDYQIGTVFSLRDTQSGNQHVEQFEDEYSQAHGIAFYRLSPKGWSSPTGEVPAAENVQKFLEVVKDPNTKKPVLVHCFAGIHRTGGHIAAYRVECCGWTNEQALTEMRSMGTPRTTFAPDLLTFVQTYSPKPVVGRAEPSK